MDTIRRYEDHRSSPGRCELPAYRQIVRDLPRPAEAQIEQMIQFVCTDHSWYKRLPLLPPGVPFHFFLDPLAGFTRIIEQGGRVIARERTAREQEEAAARCRQLSWRFTTDEYRSQFGHLACDMAGGLRFHELSLPEYGECDVFCVGDRAYRIPAEVSEVGSAKVTAVIHPLTAQPRVWDMFLPRMGGRSWPQEMGGEATLGEIRRLIRRRKEEGSRPREEIDGDLAALLAPERSRLLNEMRSAIRQMLDLIFLPGTDPTDDVPGPPLQPPGSAGGQRRR